MKIGEPLYAIVDADGTVLGNGDAPSIYGYEPEPEEVEFVREFCDRPDARVVRCVLTVEEPRP